MYSIKKFTFSNEDSMKKDQRSNLITHKELCTTIYRQEAIELCMLLNNSNLKRENEKFIYNKF